MKTLTKTDSHTHKKLIKNQLAISTIGFTMLILGLFAVCNNTLHAQSSAQTTAQVTLEGTLSMYMVTRYGDSLQELDRYRRTTKEGEYVAFILKTDEKLDMTQYLKGDELAPLIEYDETMQSEFMIVPDWEVFESFSYKDFAAKYANKRIRVTGTLFFPMGGWQNVTPVRMDFSKVELTE